MRYKCDTLQLQEPKLSCNLKNNKPLIDFDFQISDKY